MPLIDYLIAFHAVDWLIYYPSAFPAVDWLIDYLIAFHAIDWLINYLIAFHAVDWLIDYLIAFHAVDWLIDNLIAFYAVENISLILRRRAANFDLCLARVAFSIEGSFTRQHGVIMIQKGTRTHDLLTTKLQLYH
jgi:hypothetical protein